MSVITSTDPDHLDIYGTKEAYLESFRHYTELIQEGGALIIHKDLEMKQHVKERRKKYMIIVAIQEIFMQKISE